MCNTTVCVLKPDGIVTCEPLGHVVRVDECNFGRLRKTMAPQHLDVGPRDQKNGSTPKGSSRDCIYRLVSTTWDERVGGQEWSKMLSNADGTTDDG